MVKLTINGRQIEAQPEWSLLEAARANGIDIPTLCYHEAVSPAGACRLCVVELVEGKRSRIVASCVYPVSEGLEVLTDSERVLNVRRWILEMLLADCPASPEIKALAKDYGVETTRFAINNPEEQCLLCGLCVRVCREVVGLSVISTIGRGARKEIGTPYMIPSEACVACGSCVTVCPTGAMQARLDKIRGRAAMPMAASGR